ncbi:MAG: hypothetical protein DKM23_01440 [Candidatus Melainabacteria bacterium]|nr:MAG: hypothetical protein DKM23_01440 [Candidatus Melainabacteria bacterium]
MSSNYISESISLVRNLKKATKGDKFAMVNAVGNVMKVTEKLARIDNSWGEAARGALDTYSNTVATNKVAGSADKFIQVAKMSDEIGIVKSGVQVLTCSSPIRKTVEETLGWGTKFASKHLMLHVVPDMIKNTKSLNSLAKSVGDFSKNTKNMGQLPAVISGIAYSVVTVNAPKYARKIGGWICDKLGVKQYDDPKKKF